MSIQVLAWVLEHSPTKGAARLALLSIANHADDAGWAWPSNECICREANCDAKTTKRVVGDLVDDGHLLRIVNGAPDTRYRPDRRPNLYRVLRGPWCEGPTMSPPSDAAGAPGGPPRGGHPVRRGGPRMPPLTIIEPSEEPSGTTPTPPPAGGGEPLVPPVRAVFEAWCSSTGKTNRVILDEKRRRLIQRALDRYPLADVVDAVRGWENSAFHRGINERRRPYNDLALLLRDAAHVEQFRDLARGPREPDRPGRPSIDTVVTDRSAPSGRVEV